MTTNQVLNLDCRIEENKKVIQKVLKQIKPLSKYSDEEEIPLWAIEKSLVVMEKKYKMRIRNFYPDVWANAKETIWHGYVIDDESLKTMFCVHGLSLYELFSKCVIAMYSEVKKGIEKR